MTRDASRPRTSGVGRAGRLGDTAALVLVVSGAAVYAYAQYRMGQLAAGRMIHDQMSSPGIGWNLTTWGRMVSLSRAALVLIGAGVATGLASFVVHVIQKRHPAPAHEQENHSRPA